MVQRVEREPEEELEEGNRDNLHDQLQLVTNEVWYKKWKRQVAKLMREDN